MLSLSTEIVPSTQRHLLPSLATTSSSPNFVCSTNFSSSFNFPTRRRKFDFRFLICAYKLKQDSTEKKRRGTWEDPDVGSDDEEEEENLGFVSDWEEEEDDEEIKDDAEIGSFSSTGSKKYKVNLLQEVEQLLEPEERAIILQNVTPDFGKISTEKWSQLHTLALSAQIKEMDKILKNGVDVDMVDKDGLTALHTAIIGKKEAVISHLLRKGASPHIRDQDGATPLHYAVQVGAMQTVKLLIKYNADVNAADNEGWTPLHIAIQSRNRSIAKVLMVYGADRTRKNKEMRTPLDLSLCYGKDFKSFDLAKLLKILPANGEL